jgi:hypothetical protein
VAERDRGLRYFDLRNTTDPGMARRRLICGAARSHDTWFETVMDDSWDVFRRADEPHRVLRRVV